MTNLQEYIAGTDPTDPLSYLKIESVSVGQGATIRFNAAANCTYTVQFTDALGTGAWQNLANVVARSTNHIELVSDPAYVAERFYRLITPEQP